jgi:hypothetical protein
MIRRILRFGFVLGAMSILVLLARSNAASLPAASVPTVSVNAEHSAPREVEDTTQKAIARDYAAAWQVMVQALDQNRTDLLGGNFVGAASEKLTAAIQQQRKNGLNQHIVDKGHHIDVVFYSQEGSAIELHDTAQVELQVMDGGKVIHSENTTIRYVALLTAAENSWKVRLLEAVPNF